MQKEKELQKKAITKKESIFMKICILFQNQMNKMKFQQKMYMDYLYYQEVQIKKDIIYIMDMEILLLQ